MKPTKRWQKVWEELYRRRQVLLPQGRRPQGEPRASWWHQRRGQRRREGWARLMARGMMSGVTLPARGWFSL